MSKELLNLRLYSLLSTTIAQSVRNLKVVRFGHGERVIRRSPHLSCPHSRLPTIVLPTMAAPENLSTLNVSAIYVMVRYPLLCFFGAPVLTLLCNLQNKKLSDNIDGVLRMQGVS